MYDFTVCSPLYPICTAYAIYVCIGYWVMGISKKIKDNEKII